MNSTELRIGNLFYPINRSNEVHMPQTIIPMVVYGIGIFGIEFARHGENILHIPEFNKISIADISPIKLTDDWLVNLGFSKFPDCFAKTYHNQGEIFIFPPYHPTAKANNINGYYYLFQGVVHVIEYVHQVQNLFFAISGQELTLNEPLQSIKTL